ncbi:hypothetical protein TNCV_4401251 [Trichonephila clavipes]|nr:hypothetical protein TNCV_4401251 [Trichonephila clavipes]
MGLKTLNAVPCYCHHNDVEDADYHQRQHFPHHVANHWLTHVLVGTFLPTVLLHAQQSMRARNYYAHSNIRDHWVLRCMNRCPNLVVSEERPSVFKTPSKLGTQLSTQCSGDERQSRPCPAR